MTEESIYSIAYAIHQKYADRDLAHDGFSLWSMAGNFLVQLIIPFDRHPLACKLMQDTVGFYCAQYDNAHIAI